MLGDQDNPSFSNTVNKLLEELNNLNNVEFYSELATQTTVSPQYPHHLFPTSMKLFQGMASWFARQITVGEA